MEKPELLSFEAFTEMGGIRDFESYHGKTVPGWASVIGVNYNLTSEEQYDSYKLWYSRQFCKLVRALK